jgi:hypothetical protein
LKLSSPVGEELLREEIPGEELSGLQSSESEK